MTISKTLPRIVGLTVLTGAGVLMQQGTAHASVALDAATSDGGNSVQAGVPGNHVQMLTEKYGHKSSTSSSESKGSASENPKTDSSSVVSSSNSSKSCAGSDAIKSVTYTVDGKTFTTLAGNVKQGSTVTASFELNSNCDNRQVGLAAYQAPSNVWDAAKADQQVLVDHQSGTFSADGKTYTLSVTAPSCDFQVDFFTGPVLDKLSANAGYNIPGGNLISADNGGDNACVPPVITPPVKTPPVVTPPVVTPPVVTPPVVTPPVVHTDVCPTDEASRITSYTWTINGVKGFTTLTGNVKPGDKVEVDFTVAAGCNNEELSLASYAAPGASFDVNTADQQKLIDSQTGTFGPGEHVLDVNVAACFYQVDFVHGGVLTNLGPAGSNNFYGPNLIEAGNGGIACTPAPPVTPPTTVPTQVEATTITAAPATQQLAFTGSNTNELVMIGVGLTLMGAALERASARMRRRCIGGPARGPTQLTGRLATRLWRPEAGAGSDPANRSSQPNRSCFLRTSTQMDRGPTRALYLLFVVVVVVDAVRSPISKAGGALRGWHPVSLLSEILGAAIERTGIDAARIQRVVAGCATPVGEQAINISRNAVLAAGWPELVAASSVDGGATSSMFAFADIVAAINSSAIEVGIAAGVESASRVPEGASSGVAVGKPFGPLVHVRYEGDQGLASPGHVAEEMARRLGIDRAALDNYAEASRLCFENAQKSGAFKDELHIVALKNERGVDTASHVLEDSVNAVPSASTFEPLFERDGILTAATFALPADNAAATIIANSQLADANNWPVLARVLDVHITGCSPIAGESGAELLKLMLKRNGLKIRDIARLEVYEDTAVTPLALAQEASLSNGARGVVNPSGGSLATGSALGATGVSLITTLAHGLAQSDGGFGVALVGGSGGICAAALLERI